MSEKQREKTFEDDLFHAVTMCEETSWHQAYTEGINEGKTKLFIEGYAMGAQKGTEIGSEVGFYKCYALEISHLIQAKDSTPRVGKVCQAIVKLAKTFESVEAIDEALTDNLNNIRGKFKQLTSLLGVQVQYNTTIGDSVKGTSF
ncbi:hypothetical protein BsWGS_28350 [Bradybaena similaris]